MGLFDKKVVAAEPPPAPPSLQTGWVMPQTLDELREEVARLTTEYDMQVTLQPQGQHSYEAKTIEERRAQCERAIALLTEARFVGVRQMTEARVKMCNRKHFDELATEAAKIDLEPEWVLREIERQGGTADDFKPYTYGFIARDLIQLRERSAEIQKEKRRESKPRVKKEKRPWEWPGPISPPGHHAKPTKDGRYTWVGNQDSTAPEDPQAGPQDYKNLVMWAGSFGLKPADVDAHYAAIKTKAAEGTKTAMRLLQTRLQLAGQALDKGEEPVTQETKPAEAAPPKGLFSKPAAAALKAAPEPKAPSQAPPPADDQDQKAPSYTAEEWQEIAEALGIARDTSFVIDNETKANWFMKKRQTLALQIGYLLDRKAAIKHEIEVTERHLAALDERFSPELEKFFHKHKPADKKSMELVWGKIGVANSSASMSLDEKDKDELALQGWLHIQSPELKKLFECKPVPRYTRNLTVLKDWALKNETIPNGMKFTAAKTDAFYIRPSLNTIKDDWKKAGAK